MLMQAKLAQLAVIDIQQKLLPVMAAPDEVRANALKLLTAARHFQVPTLITEQYPKGIGPTEAALVPAFGETVKVFEKMAFSAAREEPVRLELAAQGQVGRLQIVICGIEAHVCVLQTALDLVEQGFQVFCVEDAVSSRLERSKSAALARLSKAGVEIVTTEMVLFEWLGRAGTADFKALLPLIK